jgi:hypothetical protein
VRTHIPAAAWAAALGLFAAGCGGGASVSGKVTLDGAPVHGGTVTFHPVAGGPTAVGAIQADGSYELAVGNERTVQPGEYVVTVEATEKPSSEAPADPRSPPKAPRRLTPAKYASTETSDLKVTVKPGGNKIPLELKGGK